MVTTLVRARGRAHRSPVPTGIQLWYAVRTPIAVRGLTHVEVFPA
ncbi:hypothetical protein V6K52_04110 [Knoellia sp. S7-12]